MDAQNANPPPPPPRYRWPWFVLAAFILAVVLAVIWMSFEVRRIRQQRDPNPITSPARTDAVR